MATLSGSLRRTWNKRLVRFGVIGAACTLLQEITLVSLVCVKVNDTLAYGIGFMLAAQVSYLLSSRFIWHDRQATTATQTSVRWLAFNLVACVALGASSVSYIAATHIGVGLLLGSLISIAFGGVVTYLVNNTVTFRCIIATEGRQDDD